MTTLPDSLLAAALNTTSAAILITDAQARIVTVNRAFTVETGYAPEDVIGQNPSLLSSGRHDADFYGQLWSDLTQQGSWRGEIWNRRRDGSLFAEWICIDAIRDARGEITNYIGVFNDISARKQREAELEWRALHDPLTALPNRALLCDRLALSLEQARRSGKLVAVLALDLDGFKAVNDVHGHAAGDWLLKEVAMRLLGGVRSCDTVCRIGGDEFVVLCPDIESPRAGTMVADRILGALRPSFAFQDTSLSIGASIGIAFFPLHGSAGEELMLRADEAMYAAKQAGKARVELAA